MSSIENTTSGSTMTIFKLLRLWSGLSGKKFASKCNISYPYWNELESGSKNNPSRDVIAKIADACGLKPETLWFFAGKEDLKAATLQRILSDSLDRIAKEL